MRSNLTKFKSIKYFIIFLFLAANFLVYKMDAADGDTIKVRTVEFAGFPNNQYGWFKFPPATEKFQRILMNYKIKCPCGEWDYDKYIFLYQFFKVDTVEPGVVRKKRVYYKDSTLQSDRFELFRFITPYGVGLPVGPNGFNWVIDVTDFEPLLHDSVYMEAFNGQEATEITFDFIKGTPPREIINIEKIWSFREIRYDPNFNKKLPEQKLFIPADAEARVKIIQTGHGMDSKENCAEFCDKTASLYINGNTFSTQHIWRDDCMLNPLYPQGGTWVYSRTNWCPGSNVRYYDYDVTSLTKAGDSNRIAYTMQNYEAKDGDYPNYRISAYLITYKKPVYDYDVAIVDIISPSMKDEYSRMNPVCSNPVVVLQNNGRKEITDIVLNLSLQTEKGPILNANLGRKFNLKPLEKKEFVVDSIPLNFSGKYNDIKFTASIRSLNNLQKDENESNNYAETHFNKTPVMYGDFILSYLTNKYASEQYSYTIKDMMGKVLYSKDNMADNTQYNDTIKLDKGCYQFEFLNKIGYGIDWWATRKDLGSGWVRFTKADQVLMNFNPDFGKQILYNFTVGAMPAITSNIDSLDFGDVKVNEKKQLYVDIMPQNEAGLTVNKVNIIFGNMKGFKLDSVVPDANAQPVQLAKGSSMRVYISFAPAKAGEALTNLSVSSNDLLDGQYYVRLRGKAIGTEGVNEYKDGKKDLFINCIVNAGRTLSIDFSLAGVDKQQAQLDLYNSIGQKVSSIFDGLADPVTNHADFDGSRITNGVYYLVLRSGQSVKSLPVVIYEY